MHTAESTRSRRRRSCRAAGVAVAVVLCSASAAFAPVGERAGIDFEPYTLTAYDGRTVDAELGMLAVPENREAGDTRMIQVAVMRLRSTAAAPGPPIVYLAGGPGNPGTNAARGRQFDAFLALRAIGDVVTIDQRGSGQSVPSLTCPQSLDLPLEERLTEEVLFEEFRARLARCRRYWEQRGADPDGYTTVQSADDIDDLLTALGVDTASLWAGSYGTHLALATLRRHPQRIHRAILMGVEGPDHTIKLPARVDKNLRRLSRLARRSPSLGGRVPDLGGLVEELLERLADAPLIATLEDPATRRSVRVAIDDLFVRLAVGAAMGDREDMASLPALLLQLEQGTVADPVARAAIEFRRFDLSPLMHWTMDCASGVSERRWTKVLRQADRFLLGRSLDLPIPDVCDAVEIPDLGQEFRARIESDVPTLFVSGTLDGRTPPANAKEIARGFGDATHLTMRLGSHDDLFTSHPELVNALLEFLDGRELSRRTIMLEPLEFAAPE